jgi:hypothetical protein
VPALGDTHRLLGIHAERRQLVPQRHLGKVAARQVERVAVDEARLAVGTDVGAKVQVRVGGE